MAPGVGLAGAEVHLERLDRFGRDGRRPGDVSEPLGSMITDEHGTFVAEHAPTLAGLHRLRVTGGSYRDPVSGALLRRDARSELRALVRLDFAEDRSDSIVVTPVHSLIEARFRQQLAAAPDPVEAYQRAHATFNALLGGLDWSTVGIAELDQPLTSPTEDVRAAFVLGGFAVLSNHMRSAGRATAQAVTLSTTTEALTDDLVDGILDGNDGNDARPGTGLELGDCPAPSASCGLPPDGCSLAACRPTCSLYANTLRTLLAQSMATFVGSRTQPSPWNHSGLYVEDVKALLDRVANRVDPELFGEACLDSADRLPPLIVWQEPQQSGQWVAGEFQVSAVAVDDSPFGARLSFRGVADDDGDPLDHRARGRVHTAGFADGQMVVIADAIDRAGNRVEEARTFWVDNTAPQVTLDSADGAYVAAGVWWSAESAVILRGTVAEAQLASVEVLVGELVVATATVDALAGTWAASIPAGHLGEDARLVKARAIDLAGNQATSAPKVMRVDAVAPSVALLRSEVYDELRSVISYEGDQQRHAVGGDAVDLAHSLPGACAMVAKHAHLLGGALPLGAAGQLNSLLLRAAIADQGVGLRPDSVQVRVTATRNDGTQVEALPWRALPAAAGGSHEVQLLADGALAIPALLTTEGTYQVSLRASDWLGRTTEVSRCWQHRVLPPKLWDGPNPGGTENLGLRATGFAQALYSTKLSPGPGEYGEFSRKLLNADAQGAAVWVRRIRNYVGRPVRVRFSVDRGVSATVQRQFVVRRQLTARRDWGLPCGSSPCPLLQPSDALITSIATHSDARFSVRVFENLQVGGGVELGSELVPCAGCEVDEEQQHYAFEIPARTMSSIKEYVVLTYLRPTLPTGAGLHSLLAPTDAASPDLDPGRYGEHLFEGVWLTGKVYPAEAYGCVSRSFDDDIRQWICDQQARPQTYRALSGVRYQLLEDVVTHCVSWAGDGLSPLGCGTSALPGGTSFSTDATALP